MRMLAFLKKTFLENIREWKILVVTLSFAPFFVYLMWAYLSTTAPAYRLIVVNRDAGAGAGGRAAADSEGLVGAWRAMKHSDGRPAFAVTETTDEAEAIRRLRNRDADVVVLIPGGFTRQVADFARSQVPATLVTHVDQGNARATVAAAYSDYVAYAYVAAAAGTRSPLETEIRPVGTSRPLTDFDLYVPALFVLALIMVMFTASATLIKEVDRGTIGRLLLSRLSVAELLTAVSINQVLVGIAALALTFLAATSLGYRTDGSLVAVLGVGAVATLGVVAMSVLVSAFLRTMFELLTVGCFPLFLVMFFSESMMPLPKVAVMQLAGHTLYANDVLPTSLAVRAFGRILNHGAGLDGVAFELGAALALTAVYYIAGGWLFARRHYSVR